MTPVAEFIGGPLDGTSYAIKEVYAVIPVETASTVRGVVVERVIEEYEFIGASDKRPIVKYYRYRGTRA